MPNHDHYHPLNYPDEPKRLSILGYAILTAFLVGALALLGPNIEVLIK